MLEYTGIKEQLYMTLGEMSAYGWQLTYDELLEALK